MTAPQRLLRDSASIDKGGDGRPWIIFTDGDGRGLAECGHWLPVSTVDATRIALPCRFCAASNAKVLSSADWAVWADKQKHNGIHRPADQPPILTKRSTWLDAWAEILRRNNPPPVEDTQIPCSNASCQRWLLSDAHSTQPHIHTPAVEQLAQTDPHKRTFINSYDSRIRGTITWQGAPIYPGKLIIMTCLHTQEITHIGSNGSRTTTLAWIKAACAEIEATHPDCVCWILPYDSLFKSRDEWIAAVVQEVLR